MAATSVALTDSEDEASPQHQYRGSLLTRYDAFDAMTQASLAGQEARSRPAVLPAGADTMAIDAGEEHAPHARTASFEWQYDALDAGKALAAVAVASPATTPDRQRAPGFFAKDVATALRQRAEWLEQLGDAALLRTEDLSDQSSEWDGKDDGASDVEAQAQSTAATTMDKPKLAGGILDMMLSTALESSVQSEPLRFQEARARFARRRLDLGAGAGCRKEEPASGDLRRQMRRPEPPARRVRRLRAEAAAFCTWAEARGGAGPGVCGEAAAATAVPPLAQEAGWLGRDARDVAGLMQRAVVSTGALAPEAVPKGVWLPPDERLGVLAARQLLALTHVAPPAAPTAAAPHELAGQATEGSVGGVAYQLSALGGRGGWFAAAEAEALQSLAERVRRVREALGSQAAPDSGSLADTTAQLHRRLDALQQVRDAPACERLRASVQLLSAEIDVAVSEAQCLEAMEAEERESDIDADFAVEETAAEQAVKLHAQVMSLDAVALRVSDVDRLLAQQEQRHVELGRFANDLAGAETRALHTGEVLRAASKAAERMREAADTSREQLQRNVVVLEAKLAAVAAQRHSGTAPPP